MWRRRRGREREVLLPPLPAGCGGRCFPARTPLCVSRGSGAALVCGPSSTQPSRGCGSAPPAVSPVPDPPRPTGPEGCSGGRRWSERAEGEDQRESPPPDALTPPPSSPSLQLGASARGRSRLLRSPRSAAPARQRGRVAGGCGQKGPFAGTAPGSAAASPSAVRRHSGLKGLAFFPVQSREERNGRKKVILRLEAKLSLKSRASATAGSRFVAQLAALPRNPVPVVGSRARMTNPRRSQAGVCGSIKMVM